MTHEFDLVRASFAASWPGRVWTGLTLIPESAWRTSWFRMAMQSAAGGLSQTPASALIRTGAIAIVVAAAMQPLLMRMMPLTVKPTVPSYAFVAIVVLAAVAAWQAEVIVKAWPNSLLARLGRR